MRKPLHQLHESDIQASEGGQRWLDEVRGYVLDIRKIDFLWDPTSINSNTHAEQDVTIEGLKVGDLPLTVIKPTFTQGILIGSSRVSAADTLSVQMANGSSGSANPPEELYTLVYIKNTTV